MAKNKFNIYPFVVLLFMLLLPGLSIFYQAHYDNLTLTIQLVGKWFLFWSVGARLFVAGIKQIAQPEFTAKEIFHFKGEESFVVIRELGFANLCLGLLGLLSLFKPLWSCPAAIAGGLYFGLAGLSHLVKKPDSKNEILAMITDLFIFALMAFYVFNIL